MARKVTIRRKPRSSEKRPRPNRTGKELAKGPGSEATQFKPGQPSANPKGRPKGSTVRGQVASNFLMLLEKPFPTNNHTYAEELLRKILHSEHLMGKLLDKLMPTLTPEQTNIMVNNFESRLAIMRAERQVASDAPTMMIEGRALPVQPQEGS